MIEEFDRLLAAASGETPGVSPSEAKALLRTMFVEHVYFSDTATGRGWLPALALAQHFCQDDGQSQSDGKLTEVINFFMKRPLSTPPNAGRAVRAISPQRWP